MAKTNVVYFINRENVELFSSAFAKTRAGKNMSGLIIAFKDFGVLTEDRMTKDADVLFVDFSVICTGRDKKVISDDSISFLERFQEKSPNVPIMVFCDNVEEEVFTLQSSVIERFTQFIFNWRATYHLQHVCQLLKESTAKKAKLAV